MTQCASINGVDMSCKHTWQMLDSWQDSDGEHFRFYCQFCLDLRQIDNPIDKEKPKHL